MSRKNKVRIAFGLATFIAISLGTLAFFATNKLWAQRDGYFEVDRVSKDLNDCKGGGGGGGDICLISTQTCVKYCTSCAYTDCYDECTTSQHSPVQ